MIGGAEAEINKDYVFVCTAAEENAGKQQSRIKDCEFQKIFKRRCFLSILTSAIPVNN